MTKEELAAQEAATAAAKAEAEVKAKAEAALQDPLKIELEKAKEHKRTEKEKAEYTLKKTAERLKEIGGDPAEVLGVKNANNEDEIPLWYQKEKAKELNKTALQLADELSDNDTKELVKSYLSNRIIPSGNPQDDFKLALGAVSSLKNKQIIEEMKRYSSPKRTASGGSAPANQEEEFIPTADEQVLMKRPYNLTKEKILAARKRAEQTQ